MSSTTPYSESQVPAGSVGGGIIGPVKHEVEASALTYKIYIFTHLIVEEGEKKRGLEVAEEITTILEKELQITVCHVLYKVNRREMRKNNHNHFC
jgi:hypothetical protein